MAIKGTRSAVMKKLAVAILITFAASFAADDYSGVWNGKGGKEDARYGLVPRTAQMTILQAGTSFTGTLKLGASAAPMKITTGTVSGSQLTFAIVSGNARITGSFSKNGTQLSGKMTASSGETF